MQAFKEEAMAKAEHKSVGKPDEVASSRRARSIW
jgi:hypothetical protein